MPNYELTDGTEPQPHVQHEARKMRRNDGGGELHMMTEIGDGVFVQWSQCSRCGKHVTECADAGGPLEPDYMKVWRNQRFKQSFAERGIEPLATPWKVRELLEEAQEAADAAYGDSNDTEIDLLRGVAESAMALLGLKFPEGRDPDDEEEDDSTEDLELLEQEARLDYEHTHVSTGDGSPAMLVSQTDEAITLVNEDGDQWTDPLSQWRPIEPSALEQTLGIKPEPLAERVDDGLNAALAAVREDKSDVGF